MSLLGGIVSSAVGSLFSSALGSASASHQLRQQFKYQKQLFEYENTHKHQFEVQDLKAAGLNPILSATNGSATSVGGVGSASLPNIENPASSARQFQLMKQEQAIKKQEADSTSINAAANAKNADTNAIVGRSQETLNKSNERLATANANSAEQLLPLQKQQVNEQIINNRMVANAQAGMFVQQGLAAAQTSSAIAAKAAQDILESKERSLGYAGQRKGQEYANMKALWANKAAEYDTQYKIHRYNVITGKEPASSAYDMYNSFWNR